jgi:parallel beta-helix repeat protein
MCISLYDSSNCTIIENRIVGNGLEGNNLIVLNGCSECIIENNSVLTACYEGIGLYSSNNNQIRNNQIDGDGHAVYLQSSSGNVIFNNSISDGGSFGIKIAGSSGNVISSNTVSDCWNGIEFEGGTGNIIFGNNFERNWNQVYGSFAGNSFNKSSEGNYYSDYKGKDANQDGIGDTPYVSEYFPNSFANVDYYPLAGRYYNFAVSTLTAGLQTLTVVSNSTVTDFADYYVPTNDSVQSDQLLQLFLEFSVAGQNGTTGFCRLQIPKAVTNSSLYMVFVDYKQVKATQLPNSNDVTEYLYFTYIHSTHQVWVFVPEFPSYLILPLFFITTLLAVTLYRKRRTKCL